MTSGISEQQQRLAILQELKDGGLTPDQARIIAFAPEIVYMTPAERNVIASLMTDPSGQYLIANNLANIAPYTPIADVIRYFATPEGKALSAQLTAENEVYQESAKRWYYSRSYEYKKRVDAVAKLRDELVADEKRYNTENGMTEAQKTQFETDLAAYNKEYDELLAINKEGESQQPPELSALAAASATPVVGGGRQFGRVGQPFGESDPYASNYLYAENIRQREAKEAEENVYKAAQAAKDEESKAFRTYQYQGGQLPFELWAAGGKMITPGIESETPQTVFSRNIPQGSTGLKNYAQSQYFDVYDEFQNTRSQLPPITTFNEETQAEVAKREMSKNTEWENFLKKYNWRQKYAGVAPTSRGEYSGVYAPRTKLVTY